MLPSAAMCAKSPKEEEKEQPQKQEKKKAIAHRLIENKSKSKGDDEKEEAERRNEEEEEEEQPQKQEAPKAANDERSRIKKDLFTKFGPKMLKLKKFHKLHQDLQQALKALSSGKTFEEMRKKGHSVFPDNEQIDALKVRLRERLEEAVGLYMKEVNSLFPDSSAVRILQDVNLALESPDWNTPKEKAEAEEIDKLKINPLDLMEGKMFYSTNIAFPLLHYYTEMTEEARQNFRKNAMIHGRTSDNMGIIEID